MAAKSCSETSIYKAKYHHSITLYNLTCTKKIHMLIHLSFSNPNYYTSLYAYKWTCTENLDFNNLKTAGHNSSKNS
jgi:hypothetical protein